MASLHLSLNQTALCLRMENLLLRILFLAMVINFLLNSSSEISGFQQPRSSLALLEKEGQSALWSFQLGITDEVSMEPKCYPNARQNNVVFWRQRKRKLRDLVPKMPSSRRAFWLVLPDSDISPDLLASSDAAVTVEWLCELSRYQQNCQNLAFWV